MNDNSKSAQILRQNMSGTEVWNDRDGWSPDPCMPCSCTASGVHVKGGPECDACGAIFHDSF